MIMGSSFFCKGGSAPNNVRSMDLNEGSACASIFFGDYELTIFVDTIEQADAIRDGFLKAFPGCGEAKI